MSDLRNWENLQYDCLVNIIGRVGVESLLLDVPFVCKSWHKATLDTSCWQHLDIPSCVISSRGGLPRTFKRFLDRFIDEYHLKIFTFDRFMSFVISRGFKSTYLDLFHRYEFRHSDEFLQHLVEKCPELTSLSLGLHSNRNVSNFIGKWKQLEEVTLEGEMKHRMFDAILAEIALNCKDFNSLIVSRASFTTKYAKSIAEHLPKIKKLRIILCYIEQNEAEIILESCKEVEYLEISKCRYFEKWDEEKLKQMGSHIKTLKISAVLNSGNCWCSEFGVSDFLYCNYDVDCCYYNDSGSVLESIRDLFMT